MSYVIGGRRTSQIGVGPDAEPELQHSHKGSTREEIDPIHRYIFWMVSLSVSALLPASLRLPYFYGGTALLYIYSAITGNMTFHLTLVALGGVCHSIEHNVWPFLVDTDEGFNDSVSALPDVAFHMVMLMFIWATQRAFLSSKVDKVTMACIVGAIINCSLTNYKSFEIEGHSKWTFHYVFFNLTSVFQAISTAFWVAGCLHYGEWDKKSYWKCLLLTNIYFVINWALYNMDHFNVWPSVHLMQLSMRYRYIEGLFIVCTWVPLYRFKLQKCVQGKKVN